MPIAIFNGHCIPPSVKIRLYCRMIDILMNIRLRLYVMMDQNRYCLKLAKTHMHMWQIADLQHRFDLIRVTNEHCVFTIARICLEHLNDSCRK